MLRLFHTIFISHYTISTIVCNWISPNQIAFGIFNQHKSNLSIKLQIGKHLRNDHQNNCICETMYQSDGIKRHQAGRSSLQARYIFRYKLTYTHTHTPRQKLFTLMTKLNAIKFCCWQTFCTSFSTNPSQKKDPKWRRWQIAKEKRKIMKIKLKSKAHFSIIKMRHKIKCTS